MYLLCGGISEPRDPRKETVSAAIIVHRETSCGIIDFDYQEPGFLQQRNNKRREDRE